MKLLYFSTLIILALATQNSYCNESITNIDQKIDALTLQLQSSAISQIDGYKGFLESDQIAQLKERIKQNEVAGTITNNKNIVLFIFYNKEYLQLLVVDTTSNNESNQISPSKIQQEINKIKGGLTQSSTTEDRIKALKRVEGILTQYKVIYKATEKELDDWVHVAKHNL